MRLTTAKKVGFSHKILRKRKELPKQAIGYMKQKSSFLVAAFSLTAFIAGNMLGQHGWYAFWKAALGQFDDTLIVYEGTVTPVEFVPDYTKWSAYGGNGEAHTYRQVPKDLLIPLPRYEVSEEKKDFDHSSEGDVFSIGHMGSYESGAEGEGSHIGVDIRVPEGTPIRAIANGVVTRVANDASGFGKLIVIRHPHMPDPESPEFETVLHSGYAHLSAQFVIEGDIVKKGQQIGLSGKTGFATGPHLHFQVDRDEAPWHPYWAFSYTEARAAGMSTSQAINAALHQERGYQYTVHPLLYTQANYPAAKFTIEPGKTIAKNTSKSVSSVKPRTRRVVTAETLAATRSDRRTARLAKATRTVAVASSSSSASFVVQSQTVATEAATVPSAPAPVLIAPAPVTAAIAGVDIQHDRQFGGRTWEKIRLTLLDASGNTVNQTSLTEKLYVRTAYGEAEFRPAMLSASDFKNGVAEVEMLPRGTRTIVISIEPFRSMSGPMEYVR